MTSAPLKKLLLFAFCTTPFLWCVTPAMAGVFNVKPIRLYLAKDSTSTVLTIQNQDTSPLRLQVSGQSWSNDRNGQPRLRSTDDLIVFPSFLNMAAFEERNIRIGFSGTPPMQKELAFRVVLDELASLESQLTRVRAPGVQIRTRITVPVFFPPDSVVQKGRVDQLTVRRGTVDLAFTNSGNVHLVAQTAQFIGQSATNTPVFSKTVSGWYVLAGETRDFKVALPHNQCGRLKSVMVIVSTDIGRYTKTELLTPNDC